MASDRVGWRRHAPRGERRREEVAELRMEAADGQGQGGEGTRAGGARGGGLIFGGGLVPCAASGWGFSLSVPWGWGFSISVPCAASARAFPGSDPCFGAAQSDATRAHLPPALHILQWRDVHRLRYRIPLWVKGEADDISPRGICDLCDAALEHLVSIVAIVHAKRILLVPSAARHQQQTHGASAIGERASLVCG